MRKSMERNQAICLPVTRSERLAMHGMWGLYFLKLLGRTINK